MIVLHGGHAGGVEIERLVEAARSVEHAIHGGHLRRVPPAYLLIERRPVLEKVRAIRHGAYVPLRDRTVDQRRVRRIGDPLADGGLQRGLLGEDVGRLRRRLRCE